MISHRSQKNGKICRRESINLRQRLAREGYGDYPEGSFEAWGIWSIHRCRHLTKMEAMIRIVFIGLGTKGSSGEMDHVKVDKETYKNILLNGNDRAASQSPG
jgi:hypothetical protein